MFTPRLNTPHSPVSGRYFVTSGSPFPISLTWISSRLGRMSRSSSLLSARICIRAQAVNSPLRARTTVALCRPVTSCPSAVVVSCRSSKHSCCSWRADSRSAWSNPSRSNPSRDGHRRAVPLSPVSNPQQARHV